MSLLTFYIVLALAVSFFCSVLEAVLLTVTPSYIISQGQKKGSKTAERLRRLKDDIEKPLAAILTLNTIAHTVGATGAGAQAQAIFGDKVVAAFSAGLTLAILILSEIIPKSLGATFWRQLAPMTARVLPVLIVLTYPFVALSQGIAYLLKGGEKMKKLNMEELNAISELGLEEGLLEKTEFNILKNFLKFGLLRVESVMTPRTVAFTLPESTTFREFFENQNLTHAQFSRIPIWGQNRDDVTGYVMKNDCYLKLLEGQDNEPISSLKREVIVVHEDVLVKKLFRILLDRHEHIAVVADEYGAVVGLVTMEDILETMLGLEIKDEIDKVEDMQKFAREKWKERAKRAGIIHEDDE